MKDLLTPKQVARAIGVSESSLKRWCDRGLIPTVRTAGGHRRLPIGGVLGFLRRTDQRLVHPELLGLPATSGTGERSLERGRDRFVEALVRGDLDAGRRIVFDLYLADHRLCVLCDRVIAAAFELIGDKWDCGEVAVYEERRACEIAVRILHELETALPPRPPDAPTAIGGTPAGDQYWLPTTMVELVLRDLGWQATSLGTSLPTATLRQALETTRPSLFWLSASHLHQPQAFIADWPSLYETAMSVHAAVVVGGRALVPEIRQQISYGAFCDTLQHLESFARTLHQHAAPKAPPE